MCALFISPSSHPNALQLYQPHFILERILLYFLFLIHNSYLFTLWGLSVFGCVPSTSTLVLSEASDISTSRMVSTIPTPLSPIQSVKKGGYMRSNASISYSSATTIIEVNEMVTVIKSTLFLHRGNSFNL